MALSGGADLALEIPVVYSSSNAGVFASAAVDILAATGVTRRVSFGMEDPVEGFRLLEPMAAVLCGETEDFRRALREFLARGFSFVQARGMALESIIPGALALLKRPNNNMALAYLKRIMEMNYDIAPAAVGRIGPNHHSEETAGGAASATAIRRMAASGDMDGACSAMPAESAAILMREYAAGRAAFEDGRFWTTVKQALVRSSARELSRVAGMREGFENRMIDMAYRSGDYESFVDACVSRRYPRSRVTRCCAHLLLNLRQDENAEFQGRGPAYIRVLGANERGRKLLGIMRRTSALPVITRASAPWSEYSAAMMRFEHRAAELWETLTDAPVPRAEARRVPVMRAGGPGALGADL
jgi:predicted nucleotidyltransferase